MGANLYLWFCGFVVLADFNLYGVGYGSCGSQGTATPTCLL